jgi:nucleoside-diphosphate-sugar epimerase
MKVKNKKNTVLITGGSGYFGSLMVKKLRKKGFNCVVFDLNDAKDRPPDVKFIKGDIRDLHAINFATRDIDYIFHNVAQVPLAKDKALFESVNYLGTENVLKAALKHKVKKIIYTSSSAVFGVPKSNPVTELTVPHPKEAYGKAKYQGELICKKYIKLGLDVSIIRPRTIMGHGRLGIFQILFEWIREGRNIPVLGDGSNVYQFVHAYDLADCCIAAALRKGPQIYNCGADKFGTMRESLEFLCLHANTGSKIKNIPVRPAIIAMRITSLFGLSPLGAYHSLMYGESMFFDTTKAKKELKWKPKYSNEQMFKESYDWYLKNRKYIVKQENASLHRSPVKQGILNIVKWIL